MYLWTSGDDAVILSRGCLLSEICRFPYKPLVIRAGSYPIGEGLFSASVILAYRSAQGSELSDPLVDSAGHRSG